MELHRILIIDDEPQILALLKQYLRGYSVFCTSDPEEAGKIAVEHQINLVICDQRLGEIKGTNILARLKELDDNMVRILFTGYEDLQAAIDAVNLGSIHRYIQKPVSKNDFLDIVLKELADYDRRSEERQKAKKMTDLENLLDEIDHH